MGNIWAFINTSTEMHQVGRDGNRNNQSTRTVTRYREGRNHMAIDGFLLRYSDVVLNMALGLSHQTKGCGDAARAAVLGNTAPAP